VTDDKVLDRTNRVNLLFDCYGPLLTEKQQSILSLYYQDNFSLGEIASDLEVSRQAVYDNVKRAEQALEDYEGKLKLLAKREARSELVEKLEAQLRKRSLGSDPELQGLLEELLQLDYTNENDDI